MFNHISDALKAIDLWFSFVRRPFRSICLLPVIFCFSALACFGQSASFAERLEKCEISVFGQSFPQLSVMKRARKLEVNLFGHTTERSVPDAVEKIENVILGGAVEPLPERQRETLKPSKPMVFEEEAEEDYVEDSPSQKIPKVADIEALLDEAVSQFERGNLAQAKKQISDILSKNPNHPDANFNAGVIAEKEGDLENAEAHYSMALRFSPNESDYLESLNSVKVKLSAKRNEEFGKPRAKKSDWEESPQEVAERHSSTASSDKGQGRAVSDGSGEDDDPQARSNDSIVGQRLYKKAAQAFKSGNYDVAADYLTELVEISPSDHKARFVLARALREAGDRRGALRQLKRAVALSPGNSQYLRELDAFDDTPCPPPTTRPSTQYGLPKQKPGGVTAMAPEPGEVVYNMAVSPLGKLIRYGLAGAAIGATYGMDGGIGMGRGALQGSLLGIGLGLIRGF